jgi:hypothetical protein
MGVDTVPSHHQKPVQPALVWLWVCHNWRFLVLLYALPCEFTRPEMLYVSSGCLAAL